MVKPLKKTKLLAVEGTDEVIFFEELFKHIGMLDIVELREVGGKDQFKIKMPTLLKTTGFNNLDAIGIIRDADENFGSAFESIKNVLKKMGIRVPDRPGQFSDAIPKVGIFIMPDNANKGMLENLCLNTVKDDKAIECVDQFIDCAKKLKKQPKNVAKTKTQAYLALMPEIANSVGRGAQKGYWNFNSVKLKPLINFLTQLKQSIT